MSITEIVAKVSRGPRESKDLTWGEAKAAMKSVLEGRASHFQVGALTVGLRTKVESVTELAAFVTAARDYSSTTVLFGERRLLDIPTYARERTNRSMLIPAAMIAVACDVPVLMHGCEPDKASWNTSTLLRALGIQTDASVSIVSNMLQDTGFGYLDIAIFHPSMNRYLDFAHEIGFPSLFYPVARLLNPANTKRHLIGMSSGQYFDKLGETLRMLGCDHALIIQGEDGEPELSMVRLLRTHEVTTSMSRPYSMRPADFSLQSGFATDFSFESIESEVEVIEQVLRNKITGTYADGVILNAAVMLYLGGMASTIQAGLPVAREALCSGVAYAALLKVRAMTSSVVSQLG